MDYPIHIETINMELLILYFNGQGQYFYKMMFFCARRLFGSKQTVQTLMKCGISSGSSLFAKRMKGLKLYPDLISRLSTRDAWMSTHICAQMLRALVEL